jgi:hypothetical protein
MGRGGYSLMREMAVLEYWLLGYWLLEYWLPGYWLLE